MPSTHALHVAIIGGGPTGMCLALALSKQGIKAAVYEAHKGIPTSVGGGILLSPNSLCVLDSLGVYQRIKEKGYQFEDLDFVTEDGTLLDRHYCGHERLYGYQALRMMRFVLLKELTSMIQGLDGVTVKYDAKFDRVFDDGPDGVTVKYDAKFDRVFDDGPDGVTFLVNGQREHADMLVGADGIHSKVRHFILPEVKRAYTGLVAVRNYLPRSKIPWLAADHQRALSIAGKGEAFMLFPEKNQHQDQLMMVGTQKPYQELDRSGWEALQADKGRLKEMLQQGYDGWADSNKSIIDSMCQSEREETSDMWPFYVIPTLDTWCSPSGQVLIVGDAAHAIHPLTGQGVNQAIEGAYSLAYLLGAWTMQERIALKEALGVWQQWRKERLKGVEKLAEIMQVKRLPEEERKQHELMESVRSLDGGGGQYAWLYGVNIDAELESRLAKPT